MARLPMFLLAALAICFNVNAVNSNSTDDANDWCLQKLKNNENLRRMGFDADYVSCEENGRDFKPRQCSGHKCWCAHLDGTVIPNTTRSSGEPHFYEAECRAFRIQAAPMMINPHPGHQTVSTSGTHGCIDCVIGPCHQCLCREALKRCSTGVANVLDIFNKAKNQYLVCEGSRITCHPCPKGLVWNCQKQVCDVVSDCPPIPKECSCECGLSKKTSQSYTMSAFTSTSVATTANTDTSTTVSYHPIHAPLPAPRSSNTVTKYDSSTVAECFKMSGGHKMSVPCDQVEQMLAKASVSVSADSDNSHPGSTRNSTTVKTTSPCSGVTTTTTSACQGGSSCPDMKTTIAVSPCKSGMKMDTEVLNLDLMAFKRCLCDEAMKTCSQPSRSICYPKYEGKYLTCYRDGRVTAHMCPPGTWWNEDMEACSTVKKCSQAFPMVCLKYKLQ